jgi:ATP-dependent DNA helicase RecG
MPSPVRCALLTGSTASGQREALYAGLASGDLDLVVGTHALIEDSGSVRNLGYIIIDEPHRVGGAQRALSAPREAIPTCWS